jgi:hypothetical protein
MMRVLIVLASTALFASALLAPGGGARRFKPLFSVELDAADAMHAAGASHRWHEHDTPHAIIMLPFRVV